ncbi:MAG TPA: transcription antitermination factor NusB [Kiritimatiellia bacterium]|nr:transcription antitermination factor NusB [Kiritimatiellia bacterium]
MSVHGRREARMWAIQVLYQIELNPETPEASLAQFWSTRKAGPKLRQFTEALVLGVRGNLAGLDATLQAYAEHWDLHRMNIVDRNILRVALYEMEYREDVPPVVSINEAIDLAKQFNGVESGRFVNGILDRICKERDRPPRTSLSGMAGKDRVS